MRQIAVVMLAVGLCSCGSGGVTKNSGPGSSNSTTNTTSATNVSTNSSTNSGSTGGGGSNNTVGQTNASNGASSCDIVTSDIQDSYCNLQAVCGDQTLLVECLLDGTWNCFCGQESFMFDENPCGDPGYYAALLAADCPPAL